MYVASEPLGEVWCDLHGSYEMHWSRDYRTCGECGHIYRSPDELLVAWLRGAQRIGIDTEGVVAGDIHFCPGCGHVFEETA